MSCGDVGAGGAAAGAAAASLGASAAAGAAVAGAAMAGAGAGAEAAGAGGGVEGAAAGVGGVVPTLPSPSAASATLETLIAPKKAINVRNCFIEFPLEGVRAGLTGADAHDLFKLENEDLAVADLAGVGCLLDRLDDAIEHVALDRGFDFDFWKEVDDIFGATVELGMALLTPKTLDLGHGDALHADGGKGLPDLVQLEWLNDCGDQFHFSPLNECVISPF